MKNIATILFAIISMVGCTSIQNEPAIAFRGISLGDQPIVGMKKIEALKEDILFIPNTITSGYVLPNEAKNISNTKVDNVIYEYYHNKLFKIRIKLSQTPKHHCTDSDDIKNGLEMTYEIKMDWKSKSYTENSFIAQWRGRENWVTYICNHSFGLKSITLENRKLGNEALKKEDEIERINSEARAQKVKADLMNPIN